MQCPKASNGEESSYLNPERERELCEESSGAVVGVQPALSLGSILGPHCTHSGKTQQEARAKVAF